MPKRRGDTAQNGFAPGSVTRQGQTRSTFLGSFPTARTGQASGTGTYQAKGSILGAEGTNLEDDRLIIKSYEDRSINLGIDQTKSREMFVDW